MHLRTTLPKTTLVLLAALGNLTGITLSVLAVDLFNESTHGFAYQMLPKMILALGLLTMTGTHVALAGGLATHWPHIAAFIGYSVPILGGALTIAFSTITVPETIEDDFRSTWVSMYADNKFGLCHIERTYGCCGFMNTTDLPVPKGCKISPEFGYQEGCFPFLKHATQVLWARASAWTLGAALAQIILLGLGVLVYAKTGNGLHLDEEMGEQGDLDDGWSVPEQQAERQSLLLQQAGSITPIPEVPAEPPAHAEEHDPSTNLPDEPVEPPVQPMDVPKQNGRAGDCSGQKSELYSRWLNEMIDKQESRVKELKQKQ
ncbi:hypothetical protein FBU59_005733 [Linderina macrospora]|uniref:Uncharacterized protein n=1 Tax=Linderina macrospora TaxID=4868 RepID=A0ACC1J1Y8_9FUNG|nr:hypothetical protein FBU59_005733 [Linderina macrospora]